MTWLNWLFQHKIIIMMSAALILLGVIASNSTAQRHREETQIEQDYLTRQYLETKRRKDMDELRRQFGVH